MSLAFKSDSLVVVSGGAKDPNIIAGTADPTAGVAGPEGSMYMRYVASAGQIFVKSGPGDTDWQQLLVTGGGSLDTAYDFGSPGGGRTIMADSGAVQIRSEVSSGQAGLVIYRSPGSAAAAVGIDLVLGANVNSSGSGISITDAGQGNSIAVAKSAAGIVLATNLSHAGAQALTVTVSAAPTSVSPVSIVANATGTTATLLSISKIPGSSTDGAGIGVSMGANATGPAITISAAGTGAALQIISGFIEVSNTVAAVSSANTGRIRYNSDAQTFQASLNGAAYVDIMTVTSLVQTVERLNADGAASPTVNTTWVSGTGTDLTLANGSTDGFIKNFVIVSGSGTITPVALADGDVLTWTSAPANVSFIWNAIDATWHVYGNPYNMVTT